MQSTIGQACEGFVLVPDHWDCCHHLVSVFEQVARNAKCSKQPIHQGSTALAVSRTEQQQMSICELRQRMFLPLQVVAAVLRRRLLDDYTLDSVTAYALANQADVLFELDSDNSTVTSDVIAELGLAVSNGTNSAIPVSLQSMCS